MLIRIAVLTTILFTSWLTAGAAELDGKWAGAVAGPRGEMQVLFNLAQEGSELRGSVASSTMGESPISEGRVEGDSFSFLQVIRRGERRFTVRYEGKITGDELRITRRVEATGGRGPAPATFTAKRAPADAKIERARRRRRQPADLPPPIAPEFKPIRAAPPFDAITDPKVIPADEVTDQVSGSELVLGAVVNGEARAWPINMLTGPSREVINDTLGGRPIAATW